MSEYMTDQMQAEEERDALVEKGALSPQEADRQADEWSEKEWEERLARFPEKLGRALAKYHITMLVMRLYEAIADRFLVDKVGMDRLTMDSSKYAQRVSNQKQGLELSRDMYSVCWKANMISYLADYSIHQAILVWGYYRYLQMNRRKKQDEDKTGALGLSLLRKSSLLGFSRFVALFLSSVGGAIGSAFGPYYGTLIGVNMGDGLAASLTEQFVDSSHLMDTFE